METFVYLYTADTQQISQFALLHYACVYQSNVFLITFLVFRHLNLKYCVKFTLNLLLTREKKLFLSFCCHGAFFTHQWSFEIF